MRGEDRDQENKPETQPEDISKILPTLRGAIRFLALVIVMLAALFLTASTFRWLEAWILLGLAIMNMVLLASLLPPGLRAERNKDHTDVKNWDRWMFRWLWWSFRTSSTWLQPGPPVRLVA